MKQILLLWIYCGTVSFVNSVHFLGGTITYRPVNESATGSPVAILITQTYSWTYTNMKCVASETLDCISSCGSTSAGYSAIGILPRCTDFSTVGDISVGQRTDIVYLYENDDFLVAFQDTAWRDLKTNPSAAWSIAARIKIEKRADNGLYNNAPVTTMMSPINIPRNVPTVIHVPVGDADGDNLRCRWSTKSGSVDECGDVCPPGSLPSGTLIFPNCTIIITGTITDAWYAVTLMVEDFTSASSTTPLSSVPVQFLVHVVAPPTCSTPPEIIGIPEEQECIAVGLGQTYQSRIYAVNYCPSPVVIEDISTLSFAGMVKGNLVKVNSSLYYKSLTWSPTSAQLGYQVMCTMAIDSKDSQSAQYCFKFFVSDKPICSCPGEPCRSTTTTTTTTSATSTTATTQTTTTSTSTSSTSATTTSTTSSTSATSTTSITSSTSTSSTSSSTSTTSTTSTTSSTSTSFTSSSTSTTTTTSTTSATSTTSTSTTSTTGTTTQQLNKNDWPWLETILSILTFIAVVIYCFCCCRYCHALGNRLYGFEKQGNHEKYLIDRCVDPNCDYSHIPISVDQSSLSCW
ncbi:hypothetical protein I4U23_031203 [Adineta vaga]|nr:hypothetical protein I4U23_031203 [Adineta vaga]